jgi:hypothetical protein
MRKLMNPKQAGITAIPGSKQTGLYATIVVDPGLRPDVRPRLCRAWTRRSASTRASTPKMRRWGAEGAYAAIAESPKRKNG